MRIRIKFLALFALPFALAACGDVTGPADLSAGQEVAGIPVSQPVSVQAIREHASGFQVGSMMRTREVFVFFDPQCPHCGQLWADTQDLHQEARFTWIPVAIMRPASLKQGAALLGADDAVALMSTHEASLSAGRGGIPGIDATGAALEAMQKNTALHASFGATGVPFIVGTHANTGALVVIPGAVPGATLARTMGWR